MKKKLAVLLVLAAMLFAFSANESKAYSNSLSANPIGLAYGFFNATYEMQMTAVNALTLSGYYISYLDFAAYGIGGSYRWYLKVGEQPKKPIEGLSVGPCGMISSWGATGFKTSASFAIGVEGAYKWVFNGLVVEPIIQLTFPLVRPEYVTPSSFGVGVNLGYAW